MSILHADLIWEELPDGMCDGAKGVYEIAAPGLIRRKLEHGGNGVLISPHMTNKSHHGRARYCLSVQNAQFYVPVDKLFEYFGNQEIPDDLWREKTAREIKVYNQQFMNGRKRRGRKSDDQIRKIGCYSLLHCPWSGQAGNLIQGEDRDADPVLGF